MIATEPTSPVFDVPTTFSHRLHHRWNQGGCQIMNWKILYLPHCLSQIVSSLIKFFILVRVVTYVVLILSWYKLEQAA
jgi:hypothetical protein